jgi:flagellar biosynthesis/type III secretory pathway protein FliH
MGLIKSNNAPSSARPFSMKDIENQARTMLLRARQQADQLLAAAQTEGESLKKAAHSQGLADGRKEGLARGREEGMKAGREQALVEQRAQLTALLGALNKTVTELNSSRRELEAAAVRDVIELGIAIAQRVTKKQGAMDPSVAMANVREAMKLVAHASDVRIAIHPQQKKILEEVLPALKMQFPKLEHVELIDDSTVAPGGCRIYTAQGTVNGDLDEQLRRVVADLVPDGAAANAGGAGGEHHAG